MVISIGVLDLILAVGADQCISAGYSYKVWSVDFRGASDGALFSARVPVAFDSSVPSHFSSAARYQTLVTLIKDVNKNRISRGDFSRLDRGITEV
jgi:hypothetical protein